MLKSQWRLACSLLAVLLTLGCSDSSGVPDTGALALRVSTSGDELDPDGYEVLVDSLAPRAIGINDSVLVEGLAPGAHVLGLAGLASNCGIANFDPPTITIEPPDPVRVLIQIECVVRTGTLQVRTYTPGPSQFDDSFTVRIDDGQFKAIAPTGAVAFVVAPGEYEVVLEIPPECSVDRPNPQIVGVDENESVRVEFVVACP